MQGYSNLSKKRQSMADFSRSLKARHFYNMEIILIVTEIHESTDVLKSINLSALQRDTYCEDINIPFIAKESILPCILLIKSISHQ